MHLWPVPFLIFQLWGKVLWNRVLVNLGVGFRLHLSYSIIRELLRVYLGPWSSACGILYALHATFNFDPPALAPQQPGWPLLPPLGIMGLTLISEVLDISVMVERSHSGR